jgi:receptor expression-enhancing protein 5/6
MTFRAVLISLLSLFFGLVYPAYGSVAAIESSTGEDDTHWLIYWLIFSIITILESVAWPILQWIPLYSELKVGLLAWLVLPQTKGALWVYEALLAPGLSRARVELAKFPALEKIIIREDPIATTTRSETENEAALADKRAKLGAAMKNVDDAFETDLRRISELKDAKARVKAENAFDKDLARLNKVASARQAGSTGKFFQGKTA